MIEIKGRRAQIVLATLSGLFAGFGSLLGKVSSSGKDMNHFIKVVITPPLTGFDWNLANAGDRLAWPILQTLQGICFVMMMLCNMIVWNLFIKALQCHTSSLPATIASSSTNYLVSATLGFAVFGEAEGLFWWMGSGVVIIGMGILTRGENYDDYDSDDDDDDEDDSFNVRLRHRNIIRLNKNTGRCPSNPHRKRD